MAVVDSLIGGQGLRLDVRIMEEEELEDKWEGSNQCMGVVLLVGDSSDLNNMSKGGEEILIGVGHSFNQQYL